MSLSNKYIKAKLTRLKNLCLIKGLQFLVFISKRKLRLNQISFPDPIIISGNHFSLFWDVSGCYKIIINDKIELPGSINTVDLDSMQVPKLLTIRFYGLGSILEKRFPIAPIYIMLKQNSGLVCCVRNFLFNSGISLNKRQRFFPLRYLNPKTPLIPDMSKLRPLVSLSFCKELFSAKVKLTLTNPEHLNQKL